MNQSACLKLSYGIYVITSGQLGQANGQIANTVFQVTSEPPQLAVSINKDNYTHTIIRVCGRFAVTILAQSAPMTFIGRFGFRHGQEFNKMQGVSYKLDQTGVPIVLDHGIAYFDALVRAEFDCGTHTLFLGEIVGAEIIGDEEPMTYAYYHLVKGGKSPKNAPTYMKP